MSATYLSGVAKGAVLMAGVSTIGDFLWAGWIPHHRPVYGLAHGTLLFMFVGLHLGSVAGRTLAGGLAGALIGFGGAGMFYLLAPLLGYSGMFVLFVAIWAALGIVHGRVLTRRSPEQDPLGRLLVRSAVAAIGSGVAFYAVSGIWFPFDPRGSDYAAHFAAWTVPYAVAFAALLWEPSGQSADSRLQVAD